MKKYLVILLALLFITAFPVSAQEDTATPEVATETPTEVATEEVTPEATPVVEPTLPAPVEDEPIIADQVQFRLGLWGFIGFCGLLILGGSGLGATWQRIRTDKKAKDDAEMLLESLSPAAQEKLDRAYQSAENAWNLLDQRTREFLQWVREITDGQPNVAGTASMVNPPHPNLSQHE